MIPSVLTRQLRQGVEDFLHTTFPVATPLFHGVLERLLRSEGSVFKGPYLSVQLPFRRGQGGIDYFPDLPLEFPPYRHQEQAFQRLAAPRYRSTLVATGTGSGKTECFLYPILDHCLRHRGERGIKAILIYPLNALAIDQAERLAKAIYRNSRLRGHVSAGLFVGESEHNPAMSMGPRNVITDKDSQRENPPDILLTNYKMLDYLLIRAKDYSLWRHNGLETLRYLVVDELHTFDGAQGTDLACLLRRLKGRLKTPQRLLCCVGTSATLGSSEEAHRLLDYAQAVFGEPFEPGAVINEIRLRAGEFLEHSLIARIEAPTAAEHLWPDAYPDYPSYILAQQALWFGDTVPAADFAAPEWRVALGERLQGHLLFQNLLKVLMTFGNRPASYAEILTELAKVTAELKAGDATYALDLLNSLVALISEARVWREETEEEHSRTTGEARPTVPFLQVRLQFWLRELRRMVCSVSQRPQLCFADDLSDEQRKRHLPLVHCRECGSMGWAGLKRRDSGQVRGDLQEFYIGFFNGDPQVTFLFPDASDTNLATWLCPGCLQLAEGTTGRSCSLCGEGELIRVYVPDNRSRRQERLLSNHHCPYCGAHDSLTLLGSRAASLTSVLIAQLFASDYNDDKKLLTFSDSVQDAAHRAGFFAARTWTFNFRTALQRVLLDHGEGLSLAELPAVFTRYWSKRLDPAAYITTFLAPNMAWFRDYDRLRQRGSLPPGSHLRQDVDRRLSWEIHSEYGFSSRIGRTLEKTGSSLVHPDPMKLNGCVEELLPGLGNEIGALRGLDRVTLRRFLLGLLYQFKTRGAVLHPELEGYIQSGGHTYQLSRIPWMPGFGPVTRAPAFPTDRSGGGRFDPLLGGRTWWQVWAEKCFSPLHPLIGAETDRLYRLTLKALTAAAIVDERRARKARVWGIRPEALRVSLQVSRFRCGHCGHGVAAESGEAQDWQGMPCLRFQCTGHYRREQGGLDYYGRLYAAGQVARLQTQEHTGLLSREERQQVESQFKAKPDQRKPWYPNLLSCTPTLEMGIDIGDLSSAILCSVPPNQASYLQRIGRTGRRDGNALNVTVANGRPHDLYFFAEPTEMLAGRIDPPGVFLDASAVLERQFTAFCLDRWVETGIGISALPARLGQVLTGLEPMNEQKFPYNVLRFIENRQTELFDRFLALFTHGLSEDSVQRLQTFVFGGNSDGGLGWRVVHGLQSLRKERDSLARKIRTLSDRVRRKQSDPAQDRHVAEELDELRREKSALQELVRYINDRDTLNFFTDEGLLPNYAFPQAGVILHSLIYRKHEQKSSRERSESGQRFDQDDGGGERRYDTWHYEYERPAVSAISELAPNNVFYAGGRRVRVDQVDMATSEPEDWRFCNNCPHMERVALESHATACPRCGSVLWSDSGQQRRLLKMRQVFATTADRQSRIGDEADDREPSFYNKQMLVDFQKRYVTDAWKVDSDALPFGFEFLSRATFREINFGEKGQQGEKVTINGLELSRKGFTVCRHCGKVQNARGEIRHALTCMARDRESADNLLDCLYLYREFSSEAIRLLLPVTTFAGSEGKLHSFVAALQLGLRRHFAGSVDHLQTAVYEEPVPESSYRKKFLLLYDTVPGGTGYLKQLMRSPEPLMAVFQAALEQLRTCVCNQDPSQDGCYRCLYAYRNSYDMGDTSRDTAVELLSVILARRDRLTRIDNLSQVSVNTLFDSELEARFVEALRRFPSYETTLVLDKQVVAGKPGYFLRLGDQAWYLEPQALLDQKQGVAIPARADFLFRPAREQPGLLPIAVFTDGYLVHRRRVGLDLAQRMAIVQSGRCLVWSLSWKDVEHCFRGQGAYFIDCLKDKPVMPGAEFSQFLRHFEAEALQPMLRENSFAWLVRYLARPDAKLWQRFAFVQGLLLLDPQRFATAADRSRWQSELQEALPAVLAKPLSALSGPCLYGLDDTAADRVRLFAAVRQEAVRRGEMNGMRLAGWLDDGEQAQEWPDFEAAWNGLLRLYNLWQFLPYGFCVTRQGLQTHAYDALVVGEPVPVIAAEPTAEDWAGVRELTDPTLHPLLTRLAERDWTVPEVGFELTDARGAVTASAELAWEALRIAFLRDDEWPDRDEFLQADWRVFALSEVLMDPDAYVDLPWH